MKTEFKEYRELIAAIKADGLDAVEQALDKAEAEFNLMQEIYLRLQQSKVQAEGRVLPDSGTFFQRLAQVTDVCRQFSADCAQELQANDAGSKPQDEVH